jgi:hypothetical protein
MTGVVQTLRGREFGGKTGIKCGRQEEKEGLVILQRHVKREEKERQK